jgi:hypothetical protein
MIVEKTKEAPVQRAPLVRQRSDKVNFASKIGRVSVVNIASQSSGAFYCDLCKCAIKDSTAYLDHINGRKRMLLVMSATQCRARTKTTIASQPHAHD